MLRDEQATTLFLALYLNIVGSIDRRCGYEHEGYQGDDAVHSFRWPEPFIHAATARDAAPTSHRNLLTTLFPMDV